MINFLNSILDLYTQISYPFSILEIFTKTVYKFIFYIDYYFYSESLNLKISSKFYMKDFHFYQNIKKNENFQNIIHNYILQDYFIFNNINTATSIKLSLLDKQQWYIFIQAFFSSLEIFLIIIQKLVYDYNDYIKSLFIWYSNYKILIYKNIVNSNLIEELYYNISLDLLLDIQNESNKSLIWLLQHTFNGKANDYLNQELWINIFKNFNIVLKKNPYQIHTNLINLYKNYPRVNMLSYGLNHDLNIFTTKFHENTINKNIWNESFLWKNILKSNKLFDKNVDNIINNSLKSFYPYFNKSLNSNFLKESEYLYDHFFFWHMNFSEYITNTSLNSKDIEHLKLKGLGDQRLELALEWNNFLSKKRPYILEAYNWYIYIKNQPIISKISSYFSYCYNNMITDLFLKKSFFHVENTFNLNLDFEKLEKDYFLKKKEEKKK